MKTFNELTEEEQDQIFDDLCSLDQDEVIPDCDLPDGTSYDYDPVLKAVIETTPQKKRFIVSLRDGEFARIRELAANEGSLEAA